MSSYNDALKCLSTEEWNKLSVQEKLDALQSVENEVAAREGRAPCKVQGQYIQSDSRGTTLGYYSRADRTITINTEQLDSNSKYGNDYKVHLDTVLHEGRHAYQHQAVRGEIKHENSEELAAWTDNMQPGHYITFEKNPRGYFSQPIEQDARSYAKSAMVGIENDKQLLKEQIQKEGNQPKVLQRDPDELRKAGQKNIEDILEMRRDDLRDKGMKDGPEMEQIIQRERKELQAEFERDAFGTSRSPQEVSQTHTNSTEQHQTGSSHTTAADQSGTGEASAGNSTESSSGHTSKDAKKAMFAGSGSQSETGHGTKKSSTTSSSKRNSISR